MWPYLALTLAILLGVTGQVVLKTGSEGARDLMGQLASPWTLGGLAVYFLSALAYIAALKRIPVSLAYPSVSISYGLMAVLAHLLWKEPLTLQHWAGILLISGGILVLFRA